MELGNLAFGHSRGQFQVPRTDDYEIPIYQLIEKVCGDESGVVRSFEQFSNAIFALNRYYWGECECGFDELESAWDEKNHHTTDCFHVLYRQEEERIKQTDLDFWKRNEHMTVWAKAHGYADAPNGMAVHCTCDYGARWDEFTKEHWHSPDCGVVKPNFLFKPTGYELRWYKYPLRDSYSNMKLNPQEFREMIDACIKTLD